MKKQIIRAVIGISTAAVMTISGVFAASAACASPIITKACTPGTSNCASVKGIDCKSLDSATVSKLCNTLGCKSLDNATLSKLCQNLGCTSLDNAAVKKLCDSGCITKNTLTNCQQAATEPTQPTTSATQPTTEPAQPTTTATQPTTEPAQPTTTATQPTKAAASSNVSDIERQVVVLVNQIRTSNGLKELKLNDSLASVARTKAEDMSNNGYFSHTSPTYGTPFDMIKASGIKYSTAGENIAKGYKTAQAVVDGWMNSPGHKANILNASYTQIGVGYAANGSLWSQMFIG